MYTILFIVIITIALYIIAKRNQAKTSKVNFKIFPTQFVVFDLETTGLNPESNEIIEIGAIKVDLSNSANSLDQLQVKSFEVLIKPTKSVPKKITEITGITQEVLDSSGGLLSDELPDFLEFIGDLPLVSYNADFDMAFLYQAVAKVFPDEQLKNKVSCALKMARKAWPGLKSYKLSELSKIMKLDADNEHRALGDTKRTLVIYVHAATELNYA